MWSLPVRNHTGNGKERFAVYFSTVYIKKEKKNATLYKNCKLFFERQSQNQFVEHTPNSKMASHVITIQEWNLQGLRRLRLYEYHEDGYEWAEARACISELLLWYLTAALIVRFLCYLLFSPCVSADESVSEARKQLFRKKKKKPDLEKQTKINPLHSL